MTPRWIKDIAERELAQKLIELILLNGDKKGLEEKVINLIRAYEHTTLDQKTIR